MARRLNFNIALSGGTHRVSVRRFNELLAAQLITTAPEQPRCGQLAGDVRAYLVDGALQVYRTAEIPVSIPSSWRLVEQQAIYSDRAKWAAEGERERWIQEDYDPIRGVNNYAIKSDSGDAAVVAV